MKIQSLKFVLKNTPTLVILTNFSQHNDHYGDERMMELLFKMGRMGEKKNQIASLSDAEMSKVAQAAAAGNPTSTTVNTGSPNAKM